MMSRRFGEQGCRIRAILEAVLVTALTQFLCALTTGLGVEPDDEPRMTFPTDDTLARWTGQARPPAGGAGNVFAPFLHVRA